MMCAGHQPLEKIAVKKFLIRGLSISAATALLSLATIAQAQTPPPAAPAAAAVKAAPAAAKAAPAAAAAKAATQAAPAVKAAAPAVVKKAAAPAASPCKGLDETACKSNSVCGWTIPTKANSKTGTVQPAYCHKMAGVAVKKPAAAAAVKAPAAAAKAPTMAPVGVTTTVPPPAKAAAPAAATK